MTTYNNFIGIDIGKFNFFVAAYGRKEVKEFDNTTAGINKFLKAHSTEFKSGLCVLETTGGYEMELLLTLCKKKVAVHRANTRHVKNFIRSYGNTAKTDALDAKALAAYGKERADALSLFKPVSEDMDELYALNSRRSDLKKILVAEKNRAQATRHKRVKFSCQKMIKAISEQIENLDEQINALFDSNESLAERKKVIMEIPGVGEITANNILVNMPELGTLDHKQTAALAGLAPVANDSGRRSGYRATNKGRANIKPVLFMAAMSARKSKSRLRDFYERLIQRGKKKMVALTALMRKILVIANAKLKQLAAEKTQINLFAQHS